MYTLSSNDLGYVAIEEEVVETISGVAAMGCYGVVGMVPQNIQSGIGEILGIESVRRGVEARASENGFIINLYCIIGYGIKISEVAANVMQHVTYAVQEIAGIPVSNVSVNVKGVKVIQ